MCTLPQRSVVCAPLSRRQISPRLQWCRILGNWTVDLVLFSDESKFSVLFDCSRKLIWFEVVIAYCRENIFERYRCATSSIMMLTGISMPDICMCLTKGSWPVDGTLKLSCFHLFNFFELLSAKNFVFWTIMHFIIAHSLYNRSWGLRYPSHWPSWTLLWPESHWKCMRCHVDTYICSTISSHIQGNPHPCNEVGMGQLA